MIIVRPILWEWVASIGINMYILKTRAHTVNPELRDHLSSWDIMQHALEVIYYVYQVLK